MVAAVEKAPTIRTKTQCKASLEGDQESLGFSKSILARNVFSEALEIVSPNSTNSIINKPIGWVSLLVTVFLLKTTGL